MMGESAKFWDRMARSYSKKAVGDEESYQKKLQITQSYLKPDMEMLEFGCGTGSTALIHAPHVKHIRATDASSEMLVIARERAEKQGISNVVFEQSTIEELKAEDAKYDIILGMSILHLLQDKEQALAKVYQMLKPGGLFVSSTVCLSGVYRCLQFVSVIGKPLGIFPLLRTFTAKQLIQSLTGARFSINYEWQIGRVMFIVAQKP